MRKLRLTGLCLRCPTEWVIPDQVTTSQSNAPLGSLLGFPDLRPGPQVGCGDSGTTHMGVGQRYSWENEVLTKTLDQSVFSRDTEPIWAKRIQGIDLCDSGNCQVRNLQNKLEDWKFWGRSQSYSHATEFFLSQGNLNFVLKAFQLIGWLLLT